jgi:hypothetical protein
VGLAVGLGLGYPVSRLYEEDIEAYTVMPGCLWEYCWLSPSECCLL